MKNKLATDLERYQQANGTALQIEFQEGVPQEIRKWIIESLSWVDGSDVRKTLLAARMENIYMHGKLDGVMEASDRALQAIKSVGVQS